MINITTIRNISRVKKLAAGAVIIGEGSANIMFIVVKGEVGVFSGYNKADSAIMQTLGTGDLFADPGLLQDKGAVYTAVALGETIIIPIDRKNINDFLKDEPALAFEVMKELFLRLAQATGLNLEPEAQQHESSSTSGSPAIGATEKNSPGKDTTPSPAGQVATSQPDAVPEAPVLPGHGTKGGAFTLFPEGHGSYELPLKEQNTAFLMNKNHTCPICKQAFSTLAVRPSKLIVASTDKDLRYHYKNIEPMYYEILTCPHCLYSALPDIFDQPEKSKGDIAKALAPLKNSVTIDFGCEKTTESIFAGYYLALFCAPVAFTKFQLVAGKLQYKLSRIYNDAGDPEMENQTALKALENYLYAYMKIGIPPSQEQQICVLIGELYFKQNDLKNAIGFFNKARTCPGGSPALKNHAENRSYEVREMAGGKK